jgi:hypothetical protein
MNLIIVILIGLIGAISTPIHSQAASDSDDGKAWQWNSPCPDNAIMQVNVLLQGKEIYSTIFPACIMVREDIPIESPQKILRFFFTANANIFNEIEEEVDFSDIGVQKIEGNIWRAGGEDDGIILGVSFMTTNSFPRKSLLNSLHFAEAHKSSETIFGEGLVIKTSVVKPSEGRRKFQ